MTLNEVLKNTNYELSLFSEEGRDTTRLGMGCIKRSTIKSPLSK